MEGNNGGLEMGEEAIGPEEEEVEEELKGVEYRVDMFLSSSDCIKCAEDFMVEM